MTLVRSVYGDCLVVFPSFSSSRSFDARRHTLTHNVPCLQRSSEGSSNRVALGNAFEGDLLSSSTLYDRRTPNFSWTESASYYDNDTEGSSRPVGGQEDAEVTSSGHVEVSYADILSLITFEDANRLVAYYRLEVLMPSEKCRAHLPPRGYVTAAKSLLKFGVRFLLN